MAAAKFTAIFGTSRRVGRWKVAKKSEALILFGRCHVDFRDAYADPEVETISLKMFCLFGSATVILPEGASVQPSVVSVLSSSRFDVDAAAPEAELPPLVFASTTVFGRCHASTVREDDEVADEQADSELGTADVPPPVSAPEGFALGLADPTPMPQLHQKPSMGAHVRLGEMESVWGDAEPAEPLAAHLSADDEGFAEIEDEGLPEVDDDTEKEPPMLSTLDPSLAVDLQDVTTIRIGA